MNAGPDTLYEGLAREKAARVDDACDRFEAAWKSLGPGQAFPDLRSFLIGFENSERDVLAQELIHLDQAYRQQRGLQTKPTDYIGLCSEYDRRVVGDDATRHQKITDLAESVQAPVLIPGLEIEDVLGTGGMGIVYKARQPVLGRYVALKVLRGVFLEDEEHRQRFLDEARAAARLQHPNLVQVYEIGETKGDERAKPMPYFVMEYVAGASLAHVLHGATPRPYEAAQLIETLARAVQHAHERGIIHRDLKPGNVLLAFSREPQASAEPALSYGARLIGGVPKIADFGLAKWLDNDRTAWTQDGALLGTPSYMAPEQTAMTKGAISPETDVYGLGAILYELLTGRPPFRAESVLATVLQVRDQEPVPVDRLQPTVPRDLQTICLKCLQKDRRKRYCTALALADDLRRFLDGKPVTARPTGAMERIAKWVRRRPAVAALIVGVLLVAALGFAGILWQFGKTVAALEQSQKANDAAQTQLYLNQIALAQHELLVHHISQAEHRLDEVPEHQRRWEWHYLKRLCQPNHLALRGHLSEIQTAAFSPDGKLLASGSGEWLSGLAGELLVWDTQSGQLLRELGRNVSTVDCVAFHPDSTRLASAGADGRIRLWNARTGEKIRELPGLGAQVNGIAFSPDGRWLVSAGSEQTVRLWNVDSGRLVRTLARHRTEVWAVAFSPDGRHFASCDKAGVVHIWNLESSSPTRSMSNLGDLRTVAFSPDNTWLAVAGYGGGLIVWDLVHTDAKPIIRHPSVSAILSLGFCPDGRLAWCSTDGSIKLQDLRTGADLQSFHGHDSHARAMAVSPNGRTIAAGGVDTALRFWDTTEPGEKSSRVLEDNPVGISELFYEPDGRLLATGGLLGTARIWDVSTRKAISIQPLGCNLTASAIHPGGRFWACVGDDKMLRVFDRSQKTEICSLPLASWPITGVAYSSDGRFLAWGSANGTVHLCNASTGMELGRLGSENSPITGVTFSPQGTHLAAATKDGVIHVWVVATGEKAARFGGLKSATLGELNTNADRTAPSAVVRLSYSPDGSRLAVAKLQHPLEIWDVNVGRVAIILSVQSAGAACVAWSPDGQRLSCGRGRSITTLDISDSGLAARRLKPSEASTWHSREVQKGWVRQDYFAVSYHLGRLLEADPKNVNLLEQRASARAILAADRRCRWEDAAGDLSRSIELGSRDSVDWYRLAVLALAAGDHNQYRKTCADMVARFRDTKEADPLNLTAWTCTLSAGAVDDAKLAVELAGRATIQSPRNHNYLNTSAAALYRAGRFQEAHKYLMESIRLQNKEGNIEDWLYLALVQHKLGEAIEARKWLAKAELHLKHRGGNNFPGDAAPKDWDQLQVLELLRREAGELLNGLKP